MVTPTNYPALPGFTNKDVLNKVNVDAKLNVLEKKKNWVVI